MNTLHPDLEALMPEPCGYARPYQFYSQAQLIDYPFIKDDPLFAGVFTADQVRAAILGATERAAKLAANLAHDAAIKYANGREVDFEQEVAAAIRGTENEGAKGS